PVRGRCREGGGFGARLRWSHRRRVAQVTRPDPRRQPARRGPSSSRGEGRGSDRRPRFRDPGRREVTRHADASSSARPQSRGRDRRARRVCGLPAGSRPTRRPALSRLAAFPLPRPRFLALLLLAAVTLALAQLSDAFVVLALAVLLAAITLAVIDYRATPEPGTLFVARIAEPQLSIGVGNRVLLRLQNPLPRPVRATLRDTVPPSFDVDRRTARLVVGPETTGEARYAERQQRILILLDAGRMMSSTLGRLTKLDHAVNTALMLSYVAIAKGDEVGLLGFADTVRAYAPPRRGRRQFLRLTEELRQLEVTMTEPDYQAAFEFLRAKTARRAFVILFTDLVDQDASRGLVSSITRLAGNNLVLCCLLQDPELLEAATREPASSTALYERVV